jgi:putative ABC transport system permease protein
MKPLRLLASALFRRARMERDMAEELALHMEYRADDLVRSGCSPAEARRRARLEFGAMEGYKERCREVRGLAWFDELRGNLRYTIRSLRASPGYASAVVLSLAIGIGANLCSLISVNSIVLHAFPYPHLNRIMMLWETNTRQGVESRQAAAANIFDWKEDTHAFEVLSAYLPWDALLTGGGEPERVQAARVSADFFSALGISPARGRGFTERECQPGSDAVVVVSHAFRKSHMPAAREPAGEKIALDGRGYTVIGVMPEEFDFPLATEMWVPLALSPEDKARRDVANLAVLGRLKAGVSAERARAELAALAATLEKRYPRTNAGRGVEIWPLGSINDITDRFVLILAFAAGFVLLLACANIGNLQLARFTARQKEMGLRAALGASRFRLVRQLLTESLVISAAGGVAGLWLGTWELGLLKAAIPAEILRWVGGLKHLQMDPGVLAFSFGLSLAAGAGCCLPSIYQLLRRRQGDGVSEALKEAGRGYTSSRAGNRARTALVSTEVALALILLVGAGLMVRTFDRMLTVNDGFDPRGLLTLEVTPSPNAYREGTQKAQYYTRALAEMGTLAGVEAAAASGGIGATKWEIEGREAPAPAEPRPGAWAITPKYFQAMRIPIVEGRPIAEQDGPDAPRVVVLSETLAHHYWRNSSPLGQRIRLGGADSPWLTVTGICGDVRDWFFGDAEPMAYVSYRQEPPAAVRFVLRTVRDPMQSAGSARLALRRVDANQAIYNVKTMEQHVAEQTSGVRTAATVMSIDAGIALLLALMGSYSVASFFVAQRTQEIGVRVALGASPRSILRMVLLQTARISSLGLAAGLSVALVLSAIMSRTLYNVVAMEPLTFVGLTAMLGASALLAAYVPARRAARVDPVIALRGE